MSSIVKTATPFIDREILCAALEKCGHNCTVQGDKIITDILDKRLGFQTFTLDSNTGKYTLEAYSFHDLNRADFVKQVGIQYNIIYKQRLEEIERARQKALAEAEKKRLEEEAERLEKERKTCVEKIENSICAKAEAQGYHIKREKINNTIKLVLVKQTY